jgi:AcrR family transcriptional regulator
MSATKEKITELGELLIRTKGYNAFSYNDISSKLGIKNAAVHYYFPSKEMLGYSVVTENLKRFTGFVHEMEKQGLNEWEQFLNFIDMYRKNRAENKKCIIGALAPDFITLNALMQKELETMSQTVLKWLTNLLSKGKKLKVFAFKETPENKALVIITSLVSSLQFNEIMNMLDYDSFYKSIAESVKP